MFFTKKSQGISTEFVVIIFIYCFMKDKNSTIAKNMSLILRKT